MSFRFQPFSRKQKQLLTWWMPQSPHKDRDAIIADGSIRAGKTLAMSLSFVFFAMENFDGQNFALAGKTIGALRRNVITPLKKMLQSRGYQVTEHLTRNSFTVRFHGRENEFYLFSGRDERSQDLIQGFTLAGVFFDEVALMPESFVEQATGRCSVDGSKYWFNCNPAGPFHWFKLKWIDRAREMNALHLHFTMDDNLSLPERIKARYRSLYSGVFFQRYILGLWVMAEGVIYDMWDDAANTFEDSDVPPGLKNSAVRYISVDYGTQNATVFGDWYDDGDTLWCMKEYYYSGRTEGVQKEDRAYVDDMDAFIADGPRPRYVIVDPSAASFKVSLRLRGYRTKDADNDVLEGIRATSTMVSKRKLKVHRRNCPNLIMERAGYVWDDKAANRGEEKPLKQADHAMDMMRYTVKTIVAPRRLNR